MWLVLSALAEGADGMTEQVALQLSPQGDWGHSQWFCLLIVTFFSLGLCQSYTNSYSGPRAPIKAL